MICGRFSESAGKNLHLQDVNGGVFGHALDLWCGRAEETELQMVEVQEIASVADRFQMLDVVGALEESMMGQLTVELCCEVLISGGGAGMGRLEAAARRLAADRFEELTRTAGFAEMEEETLGDLLDDDKLAARSEEAVWEALAAWMTAEDGRPRGRGLLRKIRFPLMDEGYLRSRAAAMLPAEQAGWVEGLVAEALAARAGGAALEPSLLGPRARIERAGPGVRWGEYAGGGERRLHGHLEAVWAVAECAGRVCSGSADGTIAVWGRATLRHERTLREDGEPDPVSALAAWGGRLVSGHDGGGLRVWCPATGACEQVPRRPEGAAPVRIRFSAHSFPCVFTVVLLMVRRMVWQRRPLAPSKSDARTRGGRSSPATTPAWSRRWPRAARAC
jgi:hypothetical protein